MYTFEQRRGVLLWTEEEDAIIKEHYSTMLKTELLRLLPQRNWISIQRHAHQLEVYRGLGGEDTKLADGDTDSMNCQLDRDFLQENRTSTTLINVYFNVSLEA